VLAALMVPDLDPYEIINLGNHRGEDLTRVISLLEKELQMKAQQDLQPMQPGDLPATFADIERARMKLGYEPTTHIDLGIPRFVQWYLQYHHLKL
jgi:UDP-glucuronate 4-epimerase